jgi:hypothetical protein
MHQYDKIWRDSHTQQARAEFEKADLALGNGGLVVLQKRFLRPNRPAWMRTNACSFHSIVLSI